MDRPTLLGINEQTKGTVKSFMEISVLSFLPLLSIKLS